MNDLEVKLEVREAKGSKLTLAMMLDSRALHVERIDVAIPKQRDGFIKHCSERYSGLSEDNKADLERELDRLADQYTRQADRGDTRASEELDVSHIVRPERFILPEVSGLTVATPTLRSGRPAGRWSLYLHWADGTREVIELADSIILPNKAKLWIYPIPSEPNIREAPGWTESARKAWLAGAKSPDPADVFRRLCECIAYYIEVMGCRYGVLNGSVQCFASFV